MSGVFDPNVYAFCNLSLFCVCKFYFSKCVYSSIAGGSNDDEHQRMKNRPHSDASEKLNELDDKFFLALSLRSESLARTPACRLCFPSNKVILWNSATFYERVYARKAFPPVSKGEKVQAIINKKRRREGKVRSILRRKKVHCDDERRSFRLEIKMFSMQEGKKKINVWLAFIDN